ncbi:MAG: SCP2 sterol-binding domain-containing protein [Thiomargarita sp.]|nr:SCP2 sterol-binding domain-containing protein [Thiomargarita sp.]
MDNIIKINNLPKFPRLFALPLGLIPHQVHSTVLATMLSRILVQSLREGELDFMRRRVLLIRVTDVQLDFCLTLIGERLVARQQCDVHDLAIEGSLYDFLLLATRREDPDTLFFNRRLRLSGNTELGLYLKNFLDSLEPEELLGPLFKHLEQMTSLFEQVGKFQSALKMK